MGEVIRFRENPKVLESFTLGHFKSPEKLLRDINKTIEDPSFLWVTLRWKETPQGTSFWANVVNNGHNDQSLSWLRACRAALVTKFPELMGI